MVIIDDQLTTHAWKSAKMRREFVCIAVFFLESVENKMCDLNLCEHGWR